MYFDEAYVRYFTESITLVEPYLSSINLSTLTETLHLVMCKKTRSDSMKTFTARAQALNNLNHTPANFTDI